MKIDPNISLETRKKIFRYSVTENRSMIKTAALLQIPVEQVREYIYLVFSDETERLKVEPNKFAIRAKNGVGLRRGYYSELTEQQMIDGGKLFTPDYTTLPKDIKPVIHSERKSFTERLRRTICYKWEDYNQFLLKIKAINKLNHKLKINGAFKKS